MTTEFKLPDLGEGIHEGEIIDVLVSAGDRVKDGQTILVVETDKASVEVPSPVTGVVKEVRVKPGDMVNVGDVLVTFDVEGEAEEVQPEEPEEKAVPVKKKEEVRAAPKEGPVPAAPSTRRVARELGVDLRQVPATGPGGRVTTEDVRAFAAGDKVVEEEAVAPEVREKPRAEIAQQPLPVPAPPLPDFAQWGSIERVPLRSIRRATAKRMALSWSQVPHVTHMDEADITDLEAFRQRHKGEINAQGG